MALGKGESFGDGSERLKCIFAALVVPKSRYDGFKWVDCKSDNKCVFGYTRTDGKQTLLVLFNFSDKYAVIAPELDGKVTMLLNTDWDALGGNKRCCTKKAIENSFLPIVEFFML